MTRAAPFDSVLLDFAKADVLIVENNESEQDILVQILSGFGARQPRRSTCSGDAMRLLGQESFDLVIVAQSLPEVSGIELVRWLRRSAAPTVRTAPVVLLSGHARRSVVLEARDCGANFVLTKPISPQVLFDRIIWLARSRRQFVECETYVGPDRRFKSYGPPPGVEGRRATDLSAEVGAAVDPNLSQDDIDALFTPARMTA